jgi:hypothetical protein
MHCKACAVLAQASNSKRFWRDAARLFILCEHGRKRRAIKNGDETATTVSLPSLVADVLAAERDSAGAQTGWVHKPHVPIPDTM